MRSILSIAPVALIILLAVGCGGDQQSGQEKKELSPGVNLHKVADEEVGIQTSDLVCGMDVTVAKMNPAADYNSKTYYFCSEHCRKAFAANPQKYEDGEESGNEHDNM